MEPTRCSFPRIIITMARPAIVLWHGRPPRLDRIQTNVTDHCGWLLIGVDQCRPVAAPKQRTVAAMAPVESLGVYSSHVPNHSRKVAVRCPKTKMIVVPHERIGEDFNSPQP